MTITIAWVTLVGLFSLKYFNTISNPSIDNSELQQQESPEQELENQAKELEAIKNLILKEDEKFIKPYLDSGFILTKSRIIPSKHNDYKLDEDVYQIYLKQGSNANGSIIAFYYIGIDSDNVYRGAVKGIGGDLFLIKDSKIQKIYIQ